MKKVLVFSMALFYVFAGTFHFYNPLFYVDIMPKNLPNPQFFIAVTGVIEILLGVLLIFKDLRKIISWIIIIMLSIFLLIIHIPDALNAILNHDGSILLTLLRIPLQLIFIYWAYKTSLIRRFQSSNKHKKRSE
jgi:uncharacterized membrane protein